MSSSYLYRLSTRFSAAPVRATAFRPTAFVARTPFLRRTAATTPNPDPKSPDAGPTSDSTNEKSVKSSRTADDPSTTEHGGSTQTPVSGKGDMTGQSEEGGAPEKQADIGTDGKPLDAADK